MATDFPLNYDASVPFGSCEHYYHFLWGYLLPAVHKMIAIESNAEVLDSKRRYLLRSCGPLMDPITREAFSLFQCDHKIVRSTQLKELESSNKFLVPRWDVRLLALTGETGLRQFLRDPHIADHYMHLTESCGFEEDLSMSMNCVRSEVLKKVKDLDTVESLHSGRGSYLILRRSPQPKYYEIGGPAESSTYGTARRSLRGIEGSIERLHTSGINARAFEPGSKSLAEQIATFHNCRGVIGVIGAEFANIIWMEPKAKVVVIRPSRIALAELTRALARLLKLEFHEMSTDEGCHPELNSEALLTVLSREK